MHARRRAFRLTRNDPHAVSHNAFLRCDAGSFFSPSCAAAQRGGTCRLVACVPVIGVDVRRGYELSANDPPPQRLLLQGRPCPSFPRRRAEAFPAEFPLGCSWVSQLTAATMADHGYGNGSDYGGNSSAAPTNNTILPNCTTELFFEVSINFCSMPAYNYDLMGVLVWTCTVCGALSVVGAAFVIVTFAIFKDLRVQSLELVR